MLQKILRFIKYNNTTAIIFTIIFSGMSISLAASPELRDSIYSSSEVVRSVDNRLIISSDLESLNFNLRINSVTEDNDNYYIDYSYATLAIQDYIWKSVSLNKKLTVDKEILEGKDLGLYIAEELSESINYELEYLKRVQALEKNKGESQKVITTEYAGLIGKFIDPKQEVIKGYSPIIPEIVSQPEAGQPLAEELSPTLSSQTPPPPAPTVDPNVIKQIVDQYLAEREMRVNTPAPAPEPTPEPQPEADQLPAEISEPEQVISPTPDPEPQIEEQSSVETQIPEPEPDSTSSPQATPEF